MNVLTGNKSSLYSNFLSHVFFAKRLTKFNYRIVFTQFSMYHSYHFFKLLQGVLYSYQFISLTALIISPEPLSSRIFERLFLTSL